MSSPPSPNDNQLLAALPEEEFQRLAPHLELAPLCLGDVLSATGQTLHHAYFPTTSIVSLHYAMANGSSAEVAGVGREGVVGISLFMGGATSTSAATVQTAGDSYRLPASLLRQEFNRSGLLMRLLLRYTQALLTQTSQTAVCNRYHSVPQQFCRWLLLTLDRLPAQELVVTQDLIAGMLGVRREAVTQAAGSLRDLGVIRYRRGHVTVLDRRLLEEHVCECYAVVKSEFARLLSDVKHRQLVQAAGS